jgi:cold shock CspA family protein
MRQIGRIKWFGGYNSRTSDNNDFGFIQCVDGDDIYVHRDDLKFSLATDFLYEGKLVTFDIEAKDVRGKKKERAVSVQLLIKEIDHDVLRNAFLTRDQKLSEIAAEILFPMLSDHEVLELIRDKVNNNLGRRQSFTQFKIDSRLANLLLLPSSAETRLVLPYETLLELLSVGVEQELDDWIVELTECSKNVTSSQWDKFCTTIDWRVAVSSPLFPLLSPFSQKRIIAREPRIKTLKELFVASSGFVCSEIAEKLYSDLVDEEILGLISRRIGIPENNGDIPIPLRHKQKISLLLLSDSGRQIRLQISPRIRLGLYEYAQHFTAFVSEIIACKEQVTSAEWSAFCRSVQAKVEYGSRIYQWVPDDVKGEIIRLKFKPLIDAIAACTHYAHNRVNWTADWLYSHLTDEDRALAAEWGKSEKDSADNKAKMLSARGAERVTYWFYRSLGMQVQDISITQLKKSSADWKIFDLRINGNSCIDVKNARTPASYRSDYKRRYAEHWVPKFKENRKSEEVMVAGVLSPYVPYHFYEHPVDPEKKIDPITFLGETTWSSIKSLEQRFSKNLLAVSMNGIHFVPAWLFEYPRSFYKERDQNCQNLNKLLTRRYPLPSAQELEIAKVNLIPGCLAARIAKEKIQPWFEALKPWQRKFYIRLCGTSAEVISLPFLFLVLLTHFMEVFLDKSQWAEYHPGGYNQLVFARQSAKNYPLGIFDPLEIIANFVETLSELWENRETVELEKYSSYRFTGKGLLEGIRPEDNTRVTLIAYCGGFIQGKGTCGKSPLIIGREKTCKCGKLICPECDYCSEGCPDRARRANVKADTETCGEPAELFDGIPF